MKRYRAQYTHEAVRVIRALHPQIKPLIRQAVDELLRKPFSGHELQFELKGFRSRKVKRYRIVYKVDEERSIIEVYYVGHRRDVYDSFRNLIYLNLP
jgi:mRNA interferase RelE/StbE